MSSGMITASSGELNNPLGHLLGNPWYANQVAGAVGKFITASWNKARELEVGVLSDLDEVEKALNGALTGPSYSVDLSTVNAQHTSPQTDVTRDNFSSLIPDATEVKTRVDYAALQPSTDGLVRKDYSALVPSLPTLPERGGLLTAAASDAIYEKARSRMLRAYTAGVQAAFYQSGAGVGMGAAKLHTALRVLEQDAKDKTSQLAIEQAAQEGIWAREDIKTILELELEHFKARWGVVRERLAAEEATLAAALKEFTDRWTVIQGRLGAEEATMETRAKIFQAQWAAQQGRLSEETSARAQKINLFLAYLQDEANRRGWSELQVKMLLDKEQARVESVLRWAAIQLQQLIAHKTALINVKASLAQSYLQLADTNLSFQGSQGISSSGN